MSEKKINVLDDNQSRKDDDIIFVGEYYEGPSAPPEHVAKLTNGKSNKFVRKATQNLPKFKWNDKAIKFMLNLFMERKSSFQDPKIRKKNLWSEVLYEMRMAGFQIPDEESLDRKMRNMKKTYKAIKIKIQNNTISRVMWEYFDLFDEIYCNNNTEMLSAKENISSSSVSSIAATSPDIVAAKEMPVFAENKSSKSAATKGLSSLQYMRKKHLLQDKRHLKVTGNILSTLKKANRFLKEQTEIFGNFINMHSVPPTVSTAAQTSDDLDMVVNDENIPSKERRIENSQTAERVGNVFGQMNQSDRPHDEASIYSESWATSYRKLDDKQKMLAKKAIDEVFVLGMFQQLEYDTVQKPTRSETPLYLLPKSDPEY